MNISLEDKIILVTGGGRGLGNACARKLFEAGGRVAIADINFDAVYNSLTNEIIELDLVL